MRLRIVGLFVALGALLAACGGGGKSALPSIVQPAASAATPGQQAKRRMAITLNVPPASKQSNARKPFYVSPNTQSVAIAVVPNGSGTPTPSELQVFPVATPSPCATTSAGGESCTFNVTAPFGTDIFYVATFAVASPNPASTTVPLSSFVSGAIVVSSPVPGVTSSPLAFTLNGIVYSVAVTVPSPDPSNTPNTQVFVAASPTSVPLGITPYDSSGAPIMSDTFLAPIPIIVTPSSEGIGLTMTPTCSTSTGSSTPSSVVDVGCAADLANVQILYPGTIFADTSDHIVDTFAIAASQQESPAPSPATVVLGSNITSFAPTGGGAYNAGYLQALPSNVIAFMLAESGVTTAEYGTFNVATGVTTSLALTGTTPAGFYEMSDGSVWVADNNLDQLECFPSGSSTSSGTWSLSGIMTQPTDVTFDGAKIWVSGYTATPSDVLAYATLTASCSISPATFNTAALPGDIFGDQGLLIAPVSGGGVLVDGVRNGGAWSVSSTAAVTSLNTFFSIGSGFGGGVGLDGAGTGYFLLNNDCTLPCNQGVLYKLPSGGSSMSQLLVVPPTQFGALAAFGPSGAADRIGYADNTDEALGIVEGPNSSTPVNILTSVGSVGLQPYGQNVAISTGGAGFIAYLNEGTLAMNIARAYLTTTWWVPVTTLANGNLFSIDERGDSGPFTIAPVGTAPACYTGSSTVAGSDHSFHLGNNTSSACVVTLQIKDKNGRSQTVTVTLHGLLT